MQFIVYLLLLGVILILQTTVLEIITIAGIKPDLVMLLVVLSGFLLGTKEGAFLGFVGGIVEDLFSGSYFGLNALSKMAAGYLAGIAGERLYRENIPVATIVTFLTSLAGLTVNYLLLLYLDIHVSPLYALFRVAIPDAAYTAVLAPFFFWRIFRYVQVRSRDF
jgi:rod shape-determining protein MreD